MYRNALTQASRRATASSIRITQPRNARARLNSTYTFDTASSSPHASQSWTRRKTVRYGAAGALAVGAYLYSAGDEDSPGIVSPPSYNSADPLSALDPSALSRTTAHLTGQSLGDLCRQWVVFAISEQSALVQAGPWMLGKIEWTRDNVPLLGSAVWAVFAFGMNQTFYRVFVGGETVPGCQQTVDDYARKGVGVMFNYSAEAPLGTSKPTSGIDQSCMNEIHSAVVEAAKLSPTVPVVSTNPNSSTYAPVDPSASQPAAVKPSLLAIKLTGLIYDASLLARASGALTNNTSFQRGDKLPPASTSNAIDANATTAAFVFPQSPDLSDEDHAQLDQLYQGLRRVCREARKQGVRLLVDAEQSWFQPAIDHFADLLAQEFNKPDSSCSVPIVYNTYQCYLRTTPSKLEAALEHATANNYSFGAKLVRGAYVESERKRHSQAQTARTEEQDTAARNPCIVWDTKGETDACYDGCSALLEKRIVQDLREGGGSDGHKSQVGVCLASHNGTSMKKFLDSLRRDGLIQAEQDGRLRVDDRLRGRVAFGQLMGMSDNLTATLLSLLPPPSSSALPLVVKYVPYATLSQGLPYLIRRANENQSILKGDPTSGRGGAREERRAVAKEIRSRMGLTF
ncbi:hypothetical protein JCM11491_002059 [Sporobolomyces phaffii]